MVVHCFAEHDVAVGVKASSQLFSVVTEVRLDGVETSVEHVALIVGGAREARLELLVGAVRDLAETPRDREPLVGWRTVVVVAAVIVGISLDGADL